MKIPAVLCKKDDGFTLLEAMIALSVLAVGLLGVIGMFTTSIGGNEQGGKVTAAATLAQQKLDQFKVTPYVNIANPTVAETAANTGINVEGAQAFLPGNDIAAPIFTRTWTVTENVILELKTITVRVSWTSKGVSHEVVLVSKRAKEA